MKKLLSTLPFLAVVSLAAQTIPATSAAPTGSVTGPQRSAVQPAIPAQNGAGAINSGVRTPNQRLVAGAISNAPGPAQTTLPNRFGATNQMAFGTNNFVLPDNELGADTPLGNIAGILSNLQARMEQALPALLAMTSQAPQTGATGAVVIDGALVPIPRPGTPVPGTREVFANIGTNIFAVSPETYRLLVILENDLRQTLPLLRVLNGTVTTGINTPRGFSGRFTPMTNTGGVLIPTGR